MDVPRGKEVARRRLIKRIVYIALILIAIPLITWGLSRLRPAAPEVELATVYPDKVRRGPMVREVRGLGTLVVTQFKWLSAQFAGRVDKMNVDNGSVVHHGDILMIIKNDQMEQDIRGLDSNIQGAVATKQAAEASKKDLAVRLQTQQLQQQSLTAQIETDYAQAQLTADKDQQLFDKGLEPDLTLQLSKSKAAQLKKSWEISKQQLEIFAQSMQAQLDAQESTIHTLDENIKKLQSDLEQKKKDLASLTITTDVDGTVVQVGPTGTKLEIGQQVTPGMILAKVSQPAQLKATLKIPETQAKDVGIGQQASVDTRNGIIPGHVTRVEPAAVNGTVDVDVSFDGPLPDGARPDLSVDGTITIEKLADVVFVGRPVIGQAGSKIGLFKIDPDRRGASRVTVTLGRASVNTIEVVDGLNVGDEVILSDMSAMDQHNRIRLR
jgi:HlyD family secretion protein